MKSSILLGLTILLSVSNVFAQDSVRIGAGNVDSVSMYDSVLHITKKADVYGSKFYEVSCETSSNLLVLKVVDNDNLVLQAEGKVKSCKQAIRDIYDVSSSERMSAVFALSSAANSDGVYGLTLTIK